MQQLEVFLIDRVFVTFAQKTQIVRVVEVFQPSRVASEFFVVGADASGILHSAMDQFLFLIPLHLKRKGRKKNGEAHHQQGLPGDCETATDEGLNSNPSQEIT